MKRIKKIATLLIILIGIFSFVKFDHENVVSNVNLNEVDVLELLAKEELGCRPSSEVMFYVDTEIIKKHRGFSEINAKVYIVDRVSGASNLLSSEHILLPYYKDTVLGNHEKIADGKWVEIKNGDKIITNNNKTSYSFTELLKYESVYNSYIRSTNKLLKINRI